MTKSIYAGVIGDPINQSRSPLIHRHWLDQYNIDGDYSAYHVKPDQLADFLKDQKGKLAGFNVTVPHKETIMKYLDQVSEEARAIGAVNTIWYERDKICGTNTDAYGFMAHLEDIAPDWKKDLPVAVLGAGGAARAIIHALIEKKVPEIRVFNRTLERAEKLKEDFGQIVKPMSWDSREKEVSNCGLLVNTTSLGMIGKPKLLMALNMAPGSTVYDIVYNPLKTDLLKEAEHKGLNIVDGLGMLLHQAVPGFEQWFGKRAEVSLELKNQIISTL